MKQLWLVLLLIMVNVSHAAIPSSDRSRKAIASVKAGLQVELAEQGLEYGAPVFMRIFKEPGTLEVWLQSKQGDFKLFKTYPICTFSGELGPKLAQGDQQAPEGFYFVRPGQLNPFSQFHLSFNLGYPNAYDRYHKRTGSALMVHGNCVSIGCYAMTDPLINEIYALANAALENGQPFFRVHAFPFALTDFNLEPYKNHQWYDFWRNLKEGYDWFEQKRTPPDVQVKQGRYTFH